MQYSIMSEDSLTGPERHAQRDQARRYRESIEKRGRCCACVHRAEVEVWGRSHCITGEDRQYPKCDRDGKLPVFEFDEAVLGELADGC